MCIDVFWAPGQKIMRLDVSGVLGADRQVSLRVSSATGATTGIFTCFERPGAKHHVCAYVLGALEPNKKSLYSFWASRGPTHSSCTCFGRPGKYIPLLKSRSGAAPKSDRLLRGSTF